MTATPIQLRALRSRDTFPVASTLYLTASSWFLFGKKRDVLRAARQSLIEGLIAPYLMYGPVLVHHLDQFLEHDSDFEMFSALRYARERGLCHDMNSVFPENEIQTANVNLDEAFVTEFNHNFDLVDYLRCATYACLMTKDEQPAPSREAWHRKWSKEMERLSKTLGRHEYTTGWRPLLSFIYDHRDDETTISTIHHTTNKIVATFDLESRRLKLSALGKKPVATHFDDGLFPTQQQTRMPVIELCLPGLVLPRLDSTKDLIDFVLEPDYQNSIANLRRYGEEVVSTERPLWEICEKIAKESRELEKSIKKERVESWALNTLYLFEIAASAARDYFLMGDLDKTTSRAAKVSKRLIDKYYDGPSYGSHPLYALSKIRKNFT